MRSRPAGRTWHDAPSDSDGNPDSQGRPEVVFVFETDVDATLAISDLHTELAASFDWGHREPWDRILAGAAFP